MSEHTVEYLIDPGSGVYIREPGQWRYCGKPVTDYRETLITYYLNNRMLGLGHGVEFVDKQTSQTFWLDTLLSYARFTPEELAEYHGGDRAYTVVDFSKSGFLLHGSYSPDNDQGLDLFYGSVVDFVRHLIANNRLVNGHLVVLHIGDFIAGFETQTVTYKVANCDKKALNQFTADYYAYTTA